MPATTRTPSSPALGRSPSPKPHTAAQPAKSDAEAQPPFFFRLFKAIKHMIEPDMSTFDPECKIDHSLLADAKPHHKAAVQLAMTDLYGKRQEAILRLPAAVERFCCERLLHDARDLRLMLTFLQVTLWLAFSSYVQLALLPRNNYAYLYAAVHLPITWIVLGQRFILAMHYAAHRPLFSPAKLGVVAQLLNAFPLVVLSNFYGMPAGAYYLHHCIMHHQANNVFPYDVSSTMPYDRSRPLHFLLYVCNFLLHTFVYLPYYAISKGRVAVALMAVGCFAGYGAAYPLIAAAQPVFFFTSLGFSFCLGPLALMLGNFSQHIFVDPDEPKSNYGLACNHLNAPFNMLTFNDGYHITHHVSSVTHWSEMPLHFIKNLDKYEQGGAILFDGINFMDLGIHVMNGEKGLRFLASKIVQLKEQPLSEAELIAMMKRRLQPIESEATKLRSSQLAIFMLGELMWIVYWACGFPLASVYAVAVGFFHVAYQVA